MKPQSKKTGLSVCLQQVVSGIPALPTNLEKISYKTNKPKHPKMKSKSDLRNPGSNLKTKAIMSVRVGNRKTPGKKVEVKPLK